MVSEITNIRYGELGKVVFDFRGHEISITEPTDVLLVGCDPTLAAKWILDRYSLLLSCLDQET